MEPKKNNPPEPAPKKEETAQVKTEAQPSKNNACIIIVVIVLLVGFFATGLLAWFTWKYFFNKKITPKINLFPTGIPTREVLNPTPLPTWETPLLQPTTATQSTPTPAVSSNYIFPDSNIREIAEAQLWNLTPWQLKVARNEIYARYGRSFVHQDLACYFATKEWYVKNPAFSSSQLTTLENKNVAIILAYEQKINSPVLNVDSGCQP